ncbi:MAG: electron transport complex subunit RsxC [Thiothrix sp.]|uniref:electron transport complex subunit RsxC n=1 Tax=Thiothrix sp. TaxID=1032 RepID=UPI00260AFC7C|nr:electron transport complex subunit RsxC [Thiothrix sp.]MDD5392358.1 electron transport complex subunit RsxC [Thiothrix sp.]
MITSLLKRWLNPGGLHLDYHKEESTQQPVRNLPLPAELVIPLQQHMGQKASLCVRVGDYVHKGQALTKPDGQMQVPVHASTSGTVTAIEEHPVAHPSGLNDLCIILTPDGKDDWGDARMTPYLDPAQEKPETLRQRISTAGIVGLGGAVFPAAIKLAAHTPITTLIINGAECEPYITCDDMLMREKPDEIIAGIQIMLHMLAPQQCLVGIEDNKPQALAAMQTAAEKAGDRRIQIVSVPTLYPTGSEKQLIKILTGKEVPSGGRPADIGMVCHNAATARAIYRAVVLGEPLLERYVTVTGEGVAHPCNLNVPLGTSVEYLLNQAGGCTPTADHLLMGGPMMGITLQSGQVPVVKATNCILVKTAPEQQQPVMPCIRCGRCAESCPANLLPQQLYWHARAREFDKTEHYHLFDCIECGCCAYVCPSHIPLVDYYRFAKAEIRTQRATHAQAEHARNRHEFRLQRLERAKQEKAEKLAKHREQAAKTGADDAKKAAIQAALARAKAKKAQAAAATTTGEPTE